MPTIPQTEAILQGYFQTGDTPTQNQFTELIGTMFYLYNEMLAEAAALSGQVAALQGALPQVLLHANSVSGAFANPAAWHFIKQYNVSNVEWTGGGPPSTNNIQITLTNNLVDLVLADLSYLLIIRNASNTLMSTTLYGANSSVAAGVLTININEPAPVAGYNVILVIF
jgi:hypothetical protein